MRSSAGNEAAGKEPRQRSHHIHATRPRPGPKLFPGSIPIHRKGGRTSCHNESRPIPTVDKMTRSTRMRYKSIGRRSHKDANPLVDPKVARPGRTPGYPASDRKKRAVLQNLACWPQWASSHQPGPHPLAAPDLDRKRSYRGTPAARHEDPLDKDGLDIRLAIGAAERAGSAARGRRRRTAEVPL